MDGLLPALLPPDDHGGQLADDGDDLGGLVGGVVLQVGAPGGGQAEAGVQQSEAEEQPGTGQQGGRSPGQVVLQQGQLYEVLRGAESATVRERQNRRYSQAFMHGKVHYRHSYIKN